MRSTVLLLNADFTPKQIVPIERAVGLLMKHLAETVAVQEGQVLRSPSVTIECPSVIRLKQYKHVPRRGAAWRGKAVLKRDNYTCIFCGTKLKPEDATVEHIYPKSKCKKEKRPYNTWTNTACACRKCQTRKGDKTLEQSGMKLLWEPRTPRTNYIVLSSDVDPEWKHYLEY